MMLLLFLWQTLRIAAPYLLAAAGGVVAERAGVVSLTLESFLLSGAFGAVAASHWGQSAWIGVLGGLGAGLFFGALHALATVRFKADQIVSGVALNLLAVGLTRFLLQMGFDSSSNSPRVPGFEGLGHPLLWLGLLIMPVLAWTLAHTRYGLRLRAVGEHPQAAESLGISVAKVRWVAVLASGGLAGLGGAFLSLDQHQFTDQMSAGRGFIALAAVISGRWQPMRAGVACLLFAAAETLQIQLQAAAAIPTQFLAMIPYALTLIAVAGVVGRSRPPAALGRA
jgi:simple sugar transport system permease protein